MGYEWIHVSPTGGTSGMTPITITCDENTGDTRTGYVIFRAGNLRKTLTVTQPGAVIITASTTSLSFTHNASGVSSSQTIDITSNTVYTIDSQSSWLTVSGTPATGVTTLTVYPNSANTGESRNATIYIKINDMTKITITATQQQGGVVPSISVSPQSLYFAYNASGVSSAQSVTVTSNVLYTINNTDWFTVSGTPAIGTTAFSVYPNSQNTGSTIRSGSLQVTYNSQVYQTVSVAQDTNQPLENNKVYYTSTDGTIVTPNEEYYYRKFLGVKILSNTYVDGQGLFVCDGEVLGVERLAFSNKNTLKSMVLPNSSIEIRDMAFQHTSLSEINIPSGVTYIGDYAFYECSSLTGLTIPDSVTYIGGGSFAGTSLTEVTIPDGVTTIRGSAFAGCLSLVSIILPNSVTELGSNTFASCSSLLSVIIPSGVTILKENLFYYCISLASVTIPDSVIYIDERAFLACGLTGLTIPDSVTTISNHAFHTCRNLQYIYCNPVIPPTLGTDVFYETNNCPIYVPSGSLNAYKTASGWSDYADRIQAMP